MSRSHWLITNRPSYRYEEAAREGRTFGVLLDTSGSMDRALLAAALGAIASYSAARDVNRRRAAPPAWSPPPCPAATG